eukprot:275735-Pleurochrysis_carterae.AAC.1
MARQSMPTAYAMSGSICVEQYNSAPTSNTNLRCMAASSVRSAFVSWTASTCLGRSSEAGACERWKGEGSSSG